jgi:pimeloyl-ACP methyl ester carboxylesterase
MGKRILVSFVIAVVGIATAPINSAASTDVSCTTSLAVTTCTGHLGDPTKSASFVLQVPAGWNGTLLLYSHGYVAPGSANPARDAGDSATAAYLLGHGYALAGSSYSATGWALKEAFADQISTLDLFGSVFGAPTRTIAWGHSLGGIITAGLLQRNPDRFDAALPMCGVVSGGIGAWNEGLDAEFVIQQLLPGGSALQTARITNPGLNFFRAGQVIANAQTTAQGRARLALAAAVSDAPGWFDPASPEPAADDYAAQQQNQFLWLSQVDAPFLFFLRAELEGRAGGNPSWNTGVNYDKQLGRSVDNAEVQALYTAAGLDLNADLAVLRDAPRVSADAAAVDYLNTYISFNGNLSGKPVLTIHTTGDGLVLPEEEQAYRSAVQRGQSAPLLREAFVHRAGHCTFTPAETIAALQALEARLNTGHWTDVTNPANLNAAAAALGPLNIAPPAYIDFTPAQFLRPFDLA